MLLPRTSTAGQSRSAGYVILLFTSVRVVTRIVQALILIYLHPSKRTLD